MSKVAFTQNGETWVASATHFPWAGFRQTGENLATALVVFRLSEAGKAKFKARDISNGMQSRSAPSPKSVVTSWAKTEISGIVEGIDRAFSQPVRAARQQDKRTDLPLTHMQPALNGAVSPNG
ncbi:MAG TPA: hypothetical protein VGU72_15525 [Beijerinckiaceae bacterium]|jgi:hypothetical protein|nr:hypothetical protein [Beijerinckiaceae bacterium]